MFGDEFGTPWKRRDEGDGRDWYDMWSDFVVWTTHTEEKMNTGEWDN